MSLQSLTRPTLSVSRICTACLQQTRNASRLKSESTSWVFNTVPVRKQLSPRQREFLEKAIRVNQAGELGANLIYAGQYALLKHDPKLKPIIAHMWDQEKVHLDTFNDLIVKHRVRPTAMRPLWNVAGYGLGLITAALGEKAAMACTEAVETEIGGHYNGQVRELLSMIREFGEELNPKNIPEGEEKGELVRLIEIVRKFRDEELEHLDTAVERGAKETDGYELLSGVIRGGCKGAIWLSSRI
ncbi:ubiquinone biosynthesis protein COQ7 [Ascobolus immersus RN42]|uniref:5-demethoxyubiquinone hydroxylase, mitochondrial n=1 Tax=Ascobolus immersus RN42 TaxID=1160509 RepID=A0A3N4ICP7_ASCIM|nr:ubiquinone biosynthesis protein COQ7 [Ascobolus immersus RN42]